LRHEVLDDRKNTQPSAFPSCAAIPAVWLSLGL
jgi:hypothetical protein